MNSHIKEHPIRLLAVLVGAILILSVAISLFSPSAPDEQLLPEESAAGDDSNLLRRPEVSLPDISIETTWSRHPDESEPEEPTIGALETSSQPEEPSDETASEPEESSEPETSVETPSQPEEPSVPPTVEPEPEPLKEYTLKVRVTNMSGDALANAEVTVGDVSGKTGSDGRFSATVTDPKVRVRVSVPGYVSYDKTLALSDASTDLSVVLSEAGGSVRSMMNALELRPYRTNVPELNAAAEKILSEITSPGMDTYDKVLACYDWVMAHMKYERATHKKRGYWACAYQAYEDGYGTCNCYTALFIVLTRYIGLETCYVEGQTSAYGGGMTFHYWTVLEMGGEYYIFDPQVEDQCIQRTASKKITHDRFCLKEPSVKYVYSSSMPRSTCIKNFEAYLLENGTFIDP